MLIQRFAAVALGIMMGTSLLLQTGTVLAAKKKVKMGAVRFMIFSSCRLKPDVVIRKSLSL